MSAIKVGDLASHVEVIGSSEREVCRVRVVRETRTQWIDDDGTRYRKDTGAQVPHFVTPRYLRPIKGDTQ